MASYTTSYSGGSQFLPQSKSGGGAAWSRPGLNKPHRLHPIPQPKLEPLGAGAGTQSGGVGRQEPLQDGSQKVVQLEKNIAFIKTQHEQTLGKLHSEIERLMQENRDLSFKVVMTQGGSGAVCCKKHNRHNQVEEDADELRSIMLEEEAHHLRNSLTNERNRNARLMNVIEQRRPKSNEPSDGESSVRSSAHGKHKYGAMTGCRPPTLAECESIIKHLQQTNDKQSHELLQIKADLKDVLYSHKWTPDAYLIARAYIGDDEKLEMSSIPPNTANSQHLMDRAYSQVRENISLPPLKVNHTTSIAEKQRRAQAIKRTKKSQFFT